MMEKTITVNNHEYDAHKAGYTNKFFPNYLSLKLLLQEKCDKKIENNAVAYYYNAISQYSYALFENLWLGYLITYSDFHVITYSLNSKSFIYSSPFKNNLPSFSMAIMHLGTCRDLLLVFVKIIVNSKTLTKDDFYKLSSPKSKYANVDKFIEDLKNISGKDNNQFFDYGKELYNNNLIRNIYAHKMRLPWWANKKCSETDYFITKDLFEDLKTNKESKKIFSIIENTQEYQNQIENSSCEEIVSATEILKETHDKIARFNNALLGELLIYLK